VGSIENVKLRPGELNDEDLQRLKNSKTVFIYREGDDPEVWRDAIKSVWTITDISLIPHTEFSTVDLTNTSVFSISGFNINTRNLSSGFSNDNTYVYLNLWMNVKGKKGKVYKKSFSRIELHPTYNDYVFLLEEDRSESFDYIYSKATLKNWAPGFIKTYLKSVNDLLRDGKERWLYVDSSAEQLKSLARNTLYIPDYLFVKFNMFTGDESEELDPKKIIDRMSVNFTLRA
jgi:hypothetical protein